jgi:SAM-dependent methyltransferase
VDAIDPRRLVATTGVDALNAAAESYFARLVNVDGLLAQPFASVNDAPALLFQLAAALQGLQLLPDHRVLDFGAGAGWSSRALTQMGCKVYALDVSATALKLGQELVARQPVIGPHHEPEFLPFDGRTIPLPDTSVDRVLCLDAFHHVPNPGEVLAELGRVLRPGGLAAFSEPGPDHSREPQSQFEMRHFGVLENDIVMRDIWRDAERAGFVGLALPLFDVAPVQLSLGDFEDFLEGDRAVEKAVVASLRRYAARHRTFFLRRAGTEAGDSRRRQGLRADLAVRLDTAVAPPGAPVHGTATVRNTSGATWLPVSTRVGAVLLGGHLLAADDGTSIDHGFFRAPLTPGAPRAITPGEVVEVRFALPPLGRGRFVVEFDMVSEGVCWFGTNGSGVARVALEIR